jgi:hypothetical protein
MAVNYLLLFVWDRRDLGELAKGKARAALLSLMRNATFRALAGPVSGISLLFLATSRLLGIATQGAENFS